ncbi:uncharacterized protein LOC110943058 [Helianthus annuus]|uniref:uncharacterized protein LOC110943058 n=1 Tax=Helianthus annuus TaxID=4232 RepID=UPI000B904C6A|nr:uncharacterized protein LOC110943058 [Helianthus annuus]
MEPDEPYYLAWERFQNLCARCSQHGLSDWALCEKFYDGLTQETRDRFDTNAGGHMMGILTIAECLERFEAFAQSQSQSRADQRELKEIKAKVDKCEFCQGGNDTNACPLLVGEEQVDFLGGGQGRGQPSGFGNINLGWRNNDNNFNNNNNFRSNGPPGFQIAQNPNRGQGSFFGGGSNGQFNKGGQGSFFGGGSNGQFNKGFNGQVKDGGSNNQVQPVQGPSYDLGGSLERMEGTLELRRVVEEDGEIVDEEIEMGAHGKVQSRLSPASTAQPGESQGEKKVEKPPVDVRPSPLIDHLRVPFPTRLRNQKYSREYGQFLDIFKQLKINLPFIEALQSMPKYAKFLKDLLRNKEKLGELSNVPLNGGCSAVVLNKLPEKLTDPGRPS